MGAVAATAVGSVAGYKMLVKQEFAEVVSVTPLSEQVETTEQHHGLLGLVEGEAEVYASLVTVGELNESRSAWDSLLGRVLEYALDSPAPFFVADTNFPYTFGAAFVTFAFAALIVPMVGVRPSLLVCRLTGMVRSPVKVKILANRS